VFKRLLWLTIGISIGFGCSFWIMRWVRERVERYYPERVVQDTLARARTVGGELRAAVEEARVAAREREAELRARLEGRV
jgi:hypothetical protein